MAKGIRGKWICFAESNSVCQKGYRKHGLVYTTPSCDTYPCSCYGKPISSFFPDNVTIILLKGSVEGVFTTEKQAEDYCKKYNIKEAEFFTSNLYSEKELPRLCDWKECNEIAVKKLTGGRMLCRKHAIEGGWTKPKPKEVKKKNG